MIYLPWLRSLGSWGIVRDREAEFSATAIISVARMIRRYGLRNFREDLYPIQSVWFFHFFNNFFPFASKLIHLYDGIKPPVSDKKQIFIDNKRERMSNEPRWNGLDIPAVKICMLQDGSIRRLERFWSYQLMVPNKIWTKTTDIQKSRRMTSYIVTRTVRRSSKLLHFLNVEISPKFVCNVLLTPRLLKCA